MITLNPRLKKPINLRSISPYQNYQGRMDRTYADQGSQQSSLFSYITNHSVDPAEPISQQINFGTKHNVNKYIVYYYPQQTMGITEALKPQSINLDEIIKDIFEDIKVQKSIDLSACNHSFIIEEYHKLIDKKQNNKISEQEQKYLNKIENFLDQEDQENDFYKENFSIVSKVHDVLKRINDDLTKLCQDIDNE